MIYTENSRRRHSYLYVYIYMDYDIGKMNPKLIEMAKDV